jgi:hypothetical protein
LMLRTEHGLAQLYRQFVKRQGVVGTTGFNVSAAEASALSHL